MRYEEKLFESLTEEGKERDPYMRFIEEKIETVYIDKNRKILDDETHLPIRKLYPHFKKWFEKIYPKIQPHSFVQAKSNFYVPNRLGKEDSVKGWIGLKIKQ